MDGVEHESEDGEEDRGEDRGEDEKDGGGEDRGEDGKEDAREEGKLEAEMKGRVGRAAGLKLGIQAAKLFTSQGGLIDDPCLLRDDDILYVSSGEDFIPVSDLKWPCDVAAAPRGPCWVTLNVGGKHFMTTRNTLIGKEPQSMLARMFSEESQMQPSLTDSFGAFVIDRSPTYFEVLLNYLRTGKVILDNNVSPEGVLEEARYFGIENVIPKLEAMMQFQVPSEGMPLTRRDVIQALITTSSKSELRFQGVNLAGADLSRLDLRNINFKFACLHGCRMTGANMSWCCLERADLSHAQMGGAQLLGVRMLCANLEGANLVGCNFEDPVGSKALLEGANLKLANLEGSNMCGVNLRVATLKNANARNCALRSAVLAGADLENCDLTGSDLHEANLRGANLKNASLELMIENVMLPADSQSLESLLDISLSGESGNQVDWKLPRGEFHCYVCGKLSSCRGSLYKHLMSVHKIRAVTRAPVRCLQDNCKYSFTYVGKLRNHLKVMHKLPIEIDSMQFETMESFLSWKRHMEEVTRSSYVKVNGQKMLKGGLRTYYYCQRAGHFRGEPDGRPRRRREYSKRMGHCISMLTATEAPGGLVNVDFCKTHYGHDAEYEIDEGPPTMVPPPAQNIHATVATSTVNMFNSGMLTALAVPSTSFGTFDFGGIKVAAMTEINELMNRVRATTSVEALNAVRNSVRTALNVLNGNDGLDSRSSPGETEAAVAALAAPPGVASGSYFTGHKIEPPIKRSKHM
ncbi:unnamed protein product [Darwinula stevensoni]|uniref:BTB/POZ domain-containing protein KCTD9 n=1 Tax=Darwinula stevensoni TaxID=69355 RepID=A0A7R8X4I8_9CRUS|nr:unnamed protein product [Darwinula stevensoni]CAG0886081.1 unnamed protein product [Darwinula stevensoni]